MTSSVLVRRNVDAKDAVDKDGQTGCPARCSCLPQALPGTTQSLSRSGRTWAFVFVYARNRSSARGHRHCARSGQEDAAAGRASRHHAGRRERLRTFACARRASHGWCRYSLCDCASHDSYAAAPATGRVHRQGRVRRGVPCAARQRWRNLCHQADQHRRHGWRRAQLRHGTRLHDGQRPVEV